MLDRTAPELLHTADNLSAGSPNLTDLESLLCDLKGAASVMRLSLDHAGGSVVETDDAQDGQERLADEIYCNAKKALETFYRLHEQIVAERQARGAAH